MDEYFADKLTEIFKFADFYNLPIYIHTGCSECDQPLQFERWFKYFPKVEVHLAHCKDPKPIITIFSKYKNIYGDTAFCPSDSYNAICKAGFKERMLFGTDFPITHYFNNHLFGKKISMKEQYLEDCNKIKFY